MDLTAKDAAKMLNVSEDTIYRWIQNGTVPFYRVRDKYRLNRVELLEWASTRKMAVAPEYFRSNGTNPADLLLTNAIRRGGVIADLACSDKTSALKAICDRIPLPAKVNRGELHNVLIAREALCSTGIGNGVAIPHPRGPIVLGIADAQVTVAFPGEPIQYGAIDGLPVKVLFLIISTTVRTHLLLLSHLMFALQDRDFKRMLDERAPEEILLQQLHVLETRLATEDSRPDNDP